jgi:hypothetical protein
MSGKRILVFERVVEILREATAKSFDLMKDGMARGIVDFYPSSESVQDIEFEISLLQLQECA